MNKKEKEKDEFLQLFMEAFGGFNRENKPKGEGIKSEDIKFEMAESKEEGLLNFNLPTIVTITNGEHTEMMTFTNKGDTIEFKITGSSDGCEDEENMDPNQEIVLLLAGIFTKGLSENFGGLKF